MYSKPTDVTVETLLEHTNRVLYDSNWDKNKGAIDNISTKNNKYGVVFIIHATVF